MLSAAKHLYRRSSSIERNSNEVEMLRCALHDVLVASRITNTATTPVVYL